MLLCYPELTVPSAKIIKNPLQLMTGYCFFAFLGVFAVILPFLYRFCGQNYKKLQFLARLLLAM